MWASVVISVVLVGLILVLFLLINHFIRERVELQADLMEVRFTHEGIQAALRHFRHDLGNMLVTLAMANEVVKAEMGSGSAAGPPGDGENGQQEPERARLVSALRLMDANTQRSIRFVESFDPGKPEQPAVLDLAILVDQLGEALVMGPEAVKREFTSWVVRKPPASMTILVGNLIKNAIDCAGEAVVRRDGDVLSIENPVSAQEAEFLGREDIYGLGVSHNGEGRGVGLEGARMAAGRCGLELGHELFSVKGRQWVRFEVGFPSEPTTTSDVRAGRQPDETAPAAPALLEASSDLEDQERRDPAGASKCREPAVESGLASPEIAE